MKRRSFLAAALTASGVALTASGVALRPGLCMAESTPAPEPIALTPAQSRNFRAWMVRMIAAQLETGPTPRWQQRDCAGLVRFATAEALRTHDEKWKRANGLAGLPVPPEVALTADQQLLRHNWRLADGSRSSYASALDMVQGNARFRTKDCNLAAPGDLLFFDQGDAQHLMVWMGAFIAYHTGTVTPDDTGLRAVSLRDLQRWHDTRWHPVPHNPNFAGVYRLNFLSA